MKNFYKFFAIFLLFSFSEQVFASENLENFFTKKLQMQLEQNIANNAKNSKNTEISTSTNTIVWENNLQNTSTTNNASQISQENISKNSEKYEFTMTFDEPKISFTDDASLLRFVGQNHGLTNEKYEPENLVAIAGTYVTGAGKLRIEAKNALDELAEEFYKTFKRKIKVVSPYRSYYDQKNIATRNPACVKAGFCAKPGHSEHQLGLAMDIEGLQAETFTKGKYRKYYDFMLENAHNYGWTQSYQKWKEIDGYGMEPWHWRYVGVELATELKNNNKTLTEYALGK